MTVSPDQFLDLARLLPDALLLVTGQGTILGVNPSGADCLARPPSELLGRSLLELAVDSQETVLEYLGYCSRENAALPGGFTLRVGGEAVRFWCRGGRIGVERQGYPRLLLRIGRQDEDTHRFSLLRLKVQELTEESLLRRQAEEELRDLNSKLEERIQDRTAELTRTNRDLEQFAWSVSHDLRSPLRAVSIFLSMFREDNLGKLDDRGRDLLERMDRSCARMGDLIESLLQLSRVTRGEIRREPVDLSDLARLVVRELREVDPGRDADVRIQAGLVDQADRALVTLILQNLIGNAWKFTGKSPSPRIDFGRATDAEGSHYFVRDNGVGFDAAAASSLFTPFVRFHLREDFEGSGIGLATVERIVLRHGGRIRADAAPGKGATFRFTLGTA